MQIHIEKIIYPGKSLGRKNNKVILTGNGIPGETIECRCIQNKKNYTLAKTEAVITPSKNRTVPRCGHFHICSSYQYIDYEHQLKIKAAQLEEILAPLNPKLFPLTLRPSNAIWGYRNKIHLHILRNNNSVQAAYHAPGSKDNFTGIDRCFLATDLMNKFTAKLIEIINAEMIEHIDEFTLQRSNFSKKLLLSCFGSLKKKDLRSLAPLIKLKDQ